MNNLTNSREFNKLKNKFSSSFATMDYSELGKKTTLQNKENAKSLLDCSRRTILHNIRPIKRQTQKTARDRSFLSNNMAAPLNKFDISMPSLFKLDQGKSHKAPPQNNYQRNNPPSHPYCSFVANNLKPSVLDSFSVHSLEPKIRHRQHPIPPLNLERSESGFLRPLNPTLEDVKRALVNEKKEELIRAMKEFKSSPNIDYVTKMYFYEKLDATLDRIMQKHLMQQETQSFHPSEWQMDQNKFQHIQTWMDKTQRETEEPYVEKPMPPSPETQSIPPISQDQSFREVESEYQLPVQQKERQGCYCLGDWTVIKGDGPCDLKVAGTLIHAIFRNAIEENHVSNNIIEVLKNNLIKTNTCTYILIGKFIDPTNSIPEKITKHIKQGGFPENWKSLAKKWHSMSGNSENCLLAQRTNLNSTRSKVQSKQNRNNDILTTPSNSGIRTSQIITRSVARKEKMRRLGLFQKLVD